ncbi:hypothetical protein GGR52DRAFT_555284 [Hypoxylon sp. FL1284]|nr:hypothetical protein GGR52DRAFT_555284 [Hypoxylon sp. FL1284]
MFLMSFSSWVSRAVSLSFCSLTYRYSARAECSVADNRPGKKYVNADVLSRMNHKPFVTTHPEPGTAAVTRVYPVHTRQAKAAGSKEKQSASPLIDTPGLSSPTPGVSTGRSSEITPTWEPTEADHRPPNQHLYQERLRMNG